MHIIIKVSHPAHRLLHTIFTRSKIVKRIILIFILTLLHQLFFTFTESFRFNLLDKSGSAHLERYSLKITRRPMASFSSKDQDIDEVKNLVGTMKTACDMLQPLIFIFYSAIASGGTSKLKADKSFFTIADGLGIFLSKLYFIISIQLQVLICMTNIL